MGFTGCGSCYGVWYNSKVNHSLVLAFSNPDVGANKIGAEIVPGKIDKDHPRAKFAHENMSKHYESEGLASKGRLKNADGKIGTLKVRFKNESGTPAKGYWSLEWKDDPPGFAW